MPYAVWVLLLLQEVPGVSVPFENTCSLRDDVMLD